MAGYLLDTSATVLCVHGGTATPTVRGARVTVNGQSIVTRSCTYTIAGCSCVVGVVYLPCVTAQWTTAATRVRAGGEPVVLADSQATSTPNGTGVTIAATQTRVKAT
jgi:hypothetical protein